MLSIVETQLLRLCILHCGPKWKRRHGWLSIVSKRRVPACCQGSYLRDDHVCSRPISGPRLSEAVRLQSLADAWHYLADILSIRHRYLGGFINRLATWGTCWDMHASRKILLKHFDERAAEYKQDMVSGDIVGNNQTDLDPTDKPVCLDLHFGAFHAEDDISLSYSGGYSRARFSAIGGVTPRSLERCYCFNLRSSIRQAM